ncbi:hypothetical protein F0562_013003 [Nyssa sinensis]|uniref:VQ domain-containing protein n=1 Tax=Nyssa sinensis TaxID=561372 RepID=A0A5J4ZZV9_9ASTE|nr:hypothetical protein F0562_013003 [Nyssa sinensis]
MPSNSTTIHLFLQNQPAGDRLRVSTVNKKADLMTETHTITETVASQVIGTGTAAAKPTTTFVQADSTSFRDVVQRLTGVGPSDTTISHDHQDHSTKAAKKSTFKLHERRQYSKSKLEILVKPAGTRQNCSFSPSNASLLYPSPLSNPSSTGSSSNKRDHQSALILSDHLNSAEEERAIKERRFYMHPSPRSKPAGYTEPELLTLFPLTSPNSTNLNI